MNIFKDEYTKGEVIAALIVGGLASVARFLAALASLLGLVVMLIVAALV